MMASEVLPRLGERLPGTGPHQEAVRGSPSAADGGDDLGADRGGGVPQSSLGAGSGFPWVSLGRAWVRFWGPLDILRTELGLAQRSLGSPSRRESGSAVPQVFSEQTEFRFGGPPGLLCRPGSGLGGGSSGSPQSTQTAVVRVRQSQGRLGFPARVALPRSPPGSGCAAARNQLPSKPGRCRGCQDPGPTDFAGTRPRHRRSMPGFLHDFVGNAHLSKGKTTESAQISELTFALKKVQFFLLTNSDVLRLPSRNYCC